MSNVLILGAAGSIAREATRLDENLNVFDFELTPDGTSTIRRW